MKTDNIHVAVFPIGSAIKLKKESIKRSDGTAEYYKLIWTLVRQKSITRVLLVQTSDWSRMTEQEKVEFDPRGVIYDAYSELKISTPKGINNKTKKEEVYYLNDALETIEKPDFGIGFPSQGFTTVNIPNFLRQLRDPSKYCTGLNMTVRYSAPIVHWLNKSMIPWYMVATDPRYCPTSSRRRDLYNIPLLGLAQYNNTITMNTIDEYKEGATESEKTINVKYTGIEKLNIINERIIHPGANKRTDKFTVVAMQSSYGKNNKDYRFDILKEWLFDNDKDKEIEVYGKWEETFTKDNPQFKGFLPSDEIDAKFENTRYTFVIPIRKDWVTSKYAEMLRVGVVPFLHPDYDTQFNVIPEDHYIRVKSPDDLFEKMEYLDKHPDKRIKLVQSLQHKLLSDTKNGQFLIDLINKANEDTGVNVRIPFQYDETVIREVKTKSLF